MSNNTTSPISPRQKCDPWYPQMELALEIPVYYVITSLQLVFGLSFNCLCLYVYYRQSKRGQEAYVYQILLASVRCLHFLIATAYSVSYVGMWSYNVYVWFRSTYGLMWYGARLATPLLDMATTTEVMLGLCMSLDRLWAVWKPMNHENFGRHKFLRTLAFVCCLVVGVLGSVYDCFRYTDPVLRSTQTQTYTVRLNTDYLNSRLGIGASWTRNVLKLLVVSMLVVINATILRIFIRRRRAIRSIILTTPEAQKQRSTFRKELTLAILTGTQCGVISIIATISVTYYAITYTHPSFDECQADFWGPIASGVMMSLQMCELYAVVVISRQFRRNIYEHVPSWMKRLFAW